MLLAIDSETKLIRRGLDAAPEPVCISYCFDGAEPVLIHARDAEEFLKEAFTFHIVVGANFAYDACVFLRWYPNLKEIIFRAYREGRVLDTQNAQRLIDLAHGELNGYRHSSGVFIEHRYSLAALYERYQLGTLEKGDDTWRLRYGELIDLPLEQWPAAAREYALNDAKATLQVYKAQQEFQELLVDLPAQCRKHLHLQLKTVIGIKTDATTCDLYMQETQQEIDRCEKLLKEHQLIRGEYDPDTGKKNPKSKIGTKDTARAKKLMEEACAELGLEPKKTDTGGISLDAEATRDTGHPILKAWSTFTSAKTIISKVAEIKEGSGEFPLQTSFDPIKENGRSSARKPGKNSDLIGVQMYNLPKTGRMRNCFVPRPKYAIVSIDFAMHELVTVSQCQIWFTGQSKLAEALNAGRDVHCEVASILLDCAYEEVLTNKKIKGSKYQIKREQSKEVNFGGWGVMTPKRLCLQMNKKRKATDALVDEDFCAYVMQAWEQAWEPQSYFEAVTNLFPDANPWSRTTIKQFISGRIRGLVDFPAACNGFFSGLAADASAEADSVVSEACYLAGPQDPLYQAHPLIHVYDEWVGEVLLDRLHDAAYEATRLFVSTAQKWTPDVKLNAEPAAMMCYDKNAETVLKNGELQIWAAAT